MYERICLFFSTLKLIEADPATKPATSEPTIWSPGALLKTPPTPPPPQIPMVIMVLVFGKAVDIIGSIPCKSTYKSRTDFLEYTCKGLSYTAGAAIRGGYTRSAYVLQIGRFTFARSFRPLHEHIPGLIYCPVGSPKIFLYFSILSSGWVLHD